MHKIYSQLKGFKICNFYMRGFNSDQDQVTCWLDEDGNGKWSDDYSFEGDGDGDGKGEHSFRTGDGVAMKVERCFEEANA
jgi:hypothetical protein